MQTIQDLAAAFRIYAVCEPCSRMVELDLRQLIEAHGSSYPVADLRRRLRCSSCEQRTQDMRIIYVGRCGAAGRFHYGNSH